MSVRDWSDEDLRRFVVRVREVGDLLGEGLNESERELFTAQAMVRIVPEVQRRLLATVGVETAPTGVAAVACNVVEQCGWGARHTWLLVCRDPWEFLTDAVFREVRSAYRHTIGKRDKKRLKRIADASSRTEIAAGGESAA